MTNHFLPEHTKLRDSIDTKTSPEIVEAMRHIHEELPWIQMEVMARNYTPYNLTPAFEDDWNAMVQIEELSELYYDKIQGLLSNKKRIWKPYKQYKY